MLSDISRNIWNTNGLLYFVTRLCCLLSLLSWVFIIFAYVYQDNLLYLTDSPIRHIYENPKSYQSPAERNMNYLTVTIERENGVKLKGWFICHLDSESNNVFKSDELENRRLVVFFHENAGNIGLRLDYFQQLYHTLGIDVLVFAYRGYSDSTGVPTEEHLKQDSHEIMKYIKDHLAKYYVNNGGIFLLGRSFGGAVAVEAFHNDVYSDMIDGIILENTFTSISDLIDHNAFVLKQVKLIFLSLEWKTIDIIPNVDVPLFFVTGKNDEIAPSEMTQTLYDAAQSAMFKEIFTAAKGSHNDTWAAEMGNYLRRMKEFMDRANSEMIPHRLLKESQDPTIPNAAELNAKAKHVN